MRQEVSTARLIIADDSAIWQRYVTDLVQDVKELQIVAQVEDAPGAVQAVSELQPDIILLDIFMPGSGIQALLAIKQLQPAPIVIMATGLSEPEIKERCLACGADHYFDKNDDVAVLRALLQQLAKTGLDPMN